MKLGIVLLCRYDSKRLPGKILREIRGRSVMSYIVERIRRAAPNTQLVVATSSHSTNDVIEAYCRRSGLECFRGSHEDVADRFLACAETYGWDYVARINGDNLFIDPDTLIAMLALADSGAYDLVTNVPGRTFPFGMSIEIVRTSFFRAAMSETQDAEHREHVTSWLYNTEREARIYVFKNTICPEASGLQLALDTPSDLDKATNILERAGADPASVGLRELYTLATTEPKRSPWSGASGPLLIAEIGGNHEGDFEVAKLMTEAAIASGVDCVKFQIYRGASLVSEIESPDRYKHFQKFELSREKHIALAKMCRAAGVAYLSSVWDTEVLEWVDPFMSFYKVGSGDLTAWPLLREFASRGKPILLSTGLATMDEVLQTVAQIQAIDERYCQPEMFCIMQCTSMYPIPDCDANLRVMDSLRATTGLAVGYSDHTTGMTALRAAAAMGAEALEFHFTLSREGQSFRDHQVSLMPDEVRQLKQEIAHITALRGDCVKTPQPSELINEHEISFRRGVYTRRAVRAGEVIDPEDLVFLRPAHGTDARDAQLVIGATALQDIDPLSAIIEGTDYQIASYSRKGVR